MNEVEILDITREAIFTLLNLSDKISLNAFSRLIDIDTLSRKINVKPTIFFIPMCNC